MPKVVKMSLEEAASSPSSEPPQEADCIRIPPQLARALALVREFKDEDVINAVKKHINNIDVPEDLRILVKLLS